MKNWKQKYNKYSLKINKYTQSGGVQDIICTFDPDGILTIPTEPISGDVNLYIQAEDGFFITDTDFLIKIPDNFLRAKRELKKMKIINETGFRVSIGNSFLSGCPDLTMIDLSPLQNITEIGNSFLSGCVSLTMIDLSSFQNVIYVGMDFLYHCISLTTIDLSPLQNIKFVAKNFLYECSDLTTIYHTLNQKPIILKYNKNLENLLKEKQDEDKDKDKDEDPYWNYTEDSNYNNDYDEFCKEMKPHSLIVLRKILDYFKIDYPKTAPREKLCKILYNEHKNHNKKYTEEEIKRMCNNEIVDPITLYEFIGMPKNNIIKLPKNEHSTVNRCYEKKSLREWCSADIYKGTGICKNPIDMQDLYLTHQEEMKQLMIFDKNEYKYNKYFEEDV